MKIQHIQALIDLWKRRHEPASGDIPLALHVARTAERDEGCPPAARSLSWHVIHDSLGAVGWDIPADEDFSSCRRAAESAAKASEQRTERIAAEVTTAEAPVLVLGAMAAGYSLFQRWDVLRSRGALLVSLDQRGHETQPRLNGFDPNGVQWADAGHLKDLFEAHSYPARLDGVTVRVPNPELIAARTTAKARTTRNLESIIFAAAARAAVASGRWSEVVALSRRLGPSSPLEAAFRLEIERWLGLELSPPTRIYFSLRRALPKAAAT